MKCTIDIMDISACIVCTSTLYVGPTHIYIYICLRKLDHNKRYNE